jgi:hypothetical protein
LRKAASARTSRTPDLRVKRSRCTNHIVRVACKKHNANSYTSRFVVDALNYVVAVCTPIGRFPRNTTSIHRLFIYDIGSRHPGMTRVSPAPTRSHFSPWETWTRWGGNLKL